MWAPAKCKVKNNRDFFERKNLNFDNMKKKVEIQLGSSSNAQMAASKKAAELAHA